MSTLSIILIIIVILFLAPQGRKVLLVLFGVIYLPLQLLFMWLQKINLVLKDRDPLLFYLSCIVIYPLYAIIIPISKLYEMFQGSMH